MKQQITKLFLLILLLIGTLSIQEVFAGCQITALSYDGSTSGNARAPSVRWRKAQGVYLITATELANAGLAPAQLISEIAWNYTTAPGVTGTGTLIVYMQNTSDVTNLKSTTWATAISGMTTVHNASTTLPNTTGFFTIPFAGGSPFTYTGGGVYIAWDWCYLAGTLSTTTVTGCNTTSNNLVTTLSGQSATATTCAAFTGAGSIFRPATMLTPGGFANDAQVDLIYTYGSMPNVFTAGHAMQARITNKGNNTLTSLNVTLNISGANTFSDVQNIPSLAPCSSTVVTFAGFTPSATGTNTVSVSVPADDNNGNNSKTMSQPVTANLYSYKYTAPLSGGVGFNAGIFGVFVSKFNTSIAAQINEVKVDFQASTASRQFRIAIYDELGGLPNNLLYSSPSVITITSAAQQAFIPITPTAVVNGNFFVGVVQETTNTVNIGFSYQTENPSRSGTFYFANALSGGPWTDFGTGFPFRSAIEVQLYIPIPPNCPLLNAPADLSLACINGTTLTWASGGGGPTGYRLTFGNNAPNYDNIQNDVDLGNVTSYVTGPLSAGTYGWKVTAYNVDGSSAGCATRTFTTNLASCYCQPTYGSGTGAGDYISLVQIPTTTLNNATAGAAAPYYTLYPQAGSTTASLGQGLPYTMNVAGGTFADCFIRGWIDYNQDGTFSASESIGISPNVGALTTGSFSFTVSGAATTGTTRMRLRSSDTTPGPADSESCGNTNSAFGETEDYDITIFATTPCSTTPAPGSTISSSPNVCSGANFTLSISTAYIESGISYQWESSPNGSSWTPVSGATNALFTTSQTSATYYHCIVTCAGNGSGTSSDLQVGMNPFYACYCTPAHFGCGNGDITNVSINTLNNTTTCTGAAYASFPASGATTTSLDKGAAYNLSVTTALACSTSVWIDWDHSGTFDASEWTMVSSSSTANVATIVSLAVPVSAQPGLTGMRIRSRLAGFQNDAGDACLGMGSGEGEDYIITVNCGGSASSNSPICSNTTLNLFAGPTGATFSWTGPASFSSALQNPSIPNALVGTNDGTYNVTVTSPGCSENLNTAVVINPLPSVTASNDAPFCSGTADLHLTSNAPTATDYLWSTGATTASVTIPSATTASNGNYTLTVTDNNGCTNSSTTNVGIWALPPVGITVIGNTNICTGQTTTDLQAGGAVDYLWSNSETTSLITVSSQGTYTVTGTDGNGCSNTDQAVITESAPPTDPVISPAGPVVLCTDGFTTTSANLTVTNYSSNLLWSTGETDQTISVNYADIFNVTYTDVNGCYSTSNSVTTSVDNYSTAPTSATTNAPFNNICLGNTVTLNMVGGTLGDNAQWVWRDGICGSGASVATGASPTITPATAGTHTYYVRSESASCGNTACASVTVTVSPNTALGTVHYTASTNAGCNGSSATFTVNPVAGAAFYNWSGTAGALFNGLPGPVQTATNSVNVTFATPPPAGASGYSICCFAGNACASSNTICAWVRAKVSQPGVIAGSNIGCPSTNSNYSIAPVAGADTYTWTVTGNATINGGTNTLTTNSTSVTVNFGGGWTNGSLNVYASLNCGFNSTTRSMSISNTPSQPGIISGPSYVCPSGSANFSVPAVTGAASYNWTCSVPGAVVTPSANSCSISFPAAIAAGSTVCVTAISSCGSASPVRCKGIANGIPNVPGNISGLTTGQCGQSGVSYSIAPVALATSYTWTANNGATVSGPNNLSSVSINFPSTFTTCTLSVIANNACGSSAARTLVVNGTPAQPGAFTSGNTSVCNGSIETYVTAGSIGATSYNWTAPAGAIILNTPPYGASVSIQWGATGGNVTVAAVNDCGTSAVRTLAVAVTCRQSQVSETMGTMVSLYPNPTDGKTTLNFESSQAKNYVIRVVDVTGRTIIRNEVAAVEGINMHELDLSSVAKGIYMVSLESNGEQAQLLKVTVE